MSIPFIRAKEGSIAKSVLLPGDPLRARTIAELFLEGVQQVYSGHGVAAYTGQYKGRAITAVGTGMGAPSITACTVELLQNYGVKNLIRCGTCGSSAVNLSCGDIVISQGASTRCQYSRRLFHANYCPIPDFGLLRTAAQTAERLDLGVKAVVGNTEQGDLFYTAKPSEEKDWLAADALGGDMETGSFYTFARRWGGRALTMFTVSDHHTKGEIMSQADRERGGILPMVRLTLETICALPQQF